MTPTPTHTTRRPSSWLVRWLLVLAACVCIGWTGQAVAGPLDDAVARLEAQEATTSGLLAEREVLARKHQAVTARIESLKQDGGGVVDDYELQSELREARALADKLKALDNEIRAERGVEDVLREEVIERYDTMIGGLEEQLVTAKPDRQLEMIAQLEQLQTSREALRSALGVGANPLEPIELPNLEGIDAADPEEMLAAADELADNEEKLREQLGELRERIDALERRRRLVAYAEDSADEANLFGEEARSTRVQGSRTSSGGNPQPTTNDGQASESPGKNGGVTTDSGTASPTAPSGDPDTDEDFAAAPDPANDGLVSPDGVENEAPPGSEDRGAPVIDVQPGTSGGSDLGGTPGLPPTSNGGSQSGVIRSDADPNVIAAGSAQGGGSLDGELRRLKAHHKRLERDIKSVQRQQKDLRKRARDLER